MCVFGLKGECLGVRVIMVRGRKNVIIVTDNVRYLAIFVGYIFSYP